MIIIQKKSLLAMTEENTIIIENLTKTYGSLVLFRNFNVSIRKNSFTVIMGSNGSGKTTLLRMIAGLEGFQQGKVLINVSPKAPSKEPSYQTAAKIGFVFQEPRLIPWKNVVDNIAYALKVQKVPKNEQLQRISEIMELLDLHTASQLFPHQLSGGMKQKVNIARALVTNPDILILDEPFNNLDVVVIEELLRLLEMIKANFGITVLMVNHYIEISAKLADQVLFLNKPNVKSPLIVEKIIDAGKFREKIKNTLFSLTKDSQIMPQVTNNSTVTVPFSFLPHYNNKR